MHEGDAAFTLLSFSTADMQIVAQLHEKAG